MLVETKRLCRIHSINPSKYRGQNFLINPLVYDNIINYADLKKTDEVLEIGPGFGFLTTKIAEKAKKIVAVELDKKLASYLESKESPLSSYLKSGQAIIRQEDILKFNPNTEFDGDYKLIANLPYNISSMVLRTYLSGANKYLSKIKRPSILILMLQKELAQRLVAQAGEMNLLAASVQHYARPKIMRLVLSGNFWPRPKVDSAIVKLEILPQVYSADQDELFFSLLKAGFSAKRKMLKNNLIKNLKLEEEILIKSFSQVEISEKARAEDLGLNDWYNLFAKLSDFML